MFCRLRSSHSWRGEGSETAAGPGDTGRESESVSLTQANFLLRQSVTDRAGEGEAAEETCWDFRKVSGTVPHGGFISKPGKRGLDRVTLRWVPGWLETAPYEELSVVCSQTRRADPVGSRRGQSWDWSIFSLVTRITESTLIKSAYDAREAGGEGLPALWRVGLGFKTTLTNWRTGLNSAR